jgi:hypothetical protein
VVGRAHNSINPDGTYNGAAITDTSKALATGGIATLSSAFVTGTTNNKVNQSEALSVTSAVGTVAQADNHINPDGTYSGSLSVKTAVSSTETSRTSIVADDYTEVIEKVHNAASIPDASAVDHASVVIDGGMNEFARYDYTKKVRTMRAPLSCPASVTWTTKAAWYAGYGWRQTHTHTLSFHFTAAEAAAAINDAGDSSYISPSGDFLWAAHKDTPVLTWETGV